MNIDLLTRNLVPLFREGTLVSLHSNIRNGKTSLDRTIRDAKSLSNLTSSVRVYVYENYQIMPNGEKSYFHYLAYYLKSHSHYNGKAIGYAVRGKYQSL